MADDDADRKQHERLGDADPGPAFEYPQSLSEADTKRGARPGHMEPSDPGAPKPARRASGPGGKSDHSRGG